MYAVMIKKSNSKAGKLSVPRRMMDAWKTWRKRTGFVGAPAEYALFAWMSMDFDTRQYWTRNYKRWESGKLPSIASGSITQPPPAGITFTDEELEYLDKFEDEIDADFENTPGLTGRVSDGFKIHRYGGDPMESKISQFAYYLRQLPIGFVSELLNGLSARVLRQATATPQPQTKRDCWHDVPEELRQRLMHYCTDGHHDCPQDVTGAALLAYLNSCEEDQAFARMKYSKWSDDHDDDVTV